MFTVQFSDELSEVCGRDVFVLREELFPQYGGGNKARKIDYWAQRISSLPTRVISCGGLHSNHLKALMCWSDEHQVPATFVVHGLLAGQSNFDSGHVTLISSAPDEVGSKMETAAEQERALGGQPCILEADMPQATECYRSLGQSIAREWGRSFQTVVGPVGTGGTLTGLVEGMVSSGWKGHALYVSVGRTAARAEQSIAAHLRAPSHLTRFSPTQGRVPHGYGTRSDDYPSVQKIMKRAEIPGNHVYSGKTIEALITSSGGPSTGPTLVLSTAPKSETAHAR